MPIVITYTLQPVSASDINQLVVRPGNLNGAQKTALIGFINSHIVPPFNTQRGL